MSFQNPEEVAGVSVSEFHKSFKNVDNRWKSVIEFQRELEEKMEGLSMDKSYSQRYLNVGFSGGEKKKTEILQMAMLNPLTLCLMKRSGLDIDAVKIVSENIEKFRNENKAIIIITHHREILSRINPDLFMF